MRVILSPYAHELDSTGWKCAEDCPACRWVEEREQALRRENVRSRMDLEVTSVIGEMVESRL